MPVTTRYGVKNAPNADGSGWSTLSAPLAGGGGSFTVVSATPYLQTLTTEVIVGLITAGVLSNYERMVVRFSGATATIVSREGALVHAAGETVIMDWGQLTALNNPQAATDAGDLSVLASTGLMSRWAVPGSDGAYVATFTSGVPSWTLATTAVAPGGSVNSVQFNNAGAFGGFGSWDALTSNLRVSGLVSLGNTTSIYDDAYRILRIHQNETTVSGALINPIWSDSYYTPTLGDAGSIGAVNVDASVLGANDAGSVYAISGNAFHSGSGAVTAVYGISAGATVNGGGTAARAEGIGTSIDIEAGATVTSAYGYRFNDITLNGTTTDYFGFHAPAPTRAAGTLTNYYTIFVADHAGASSGVNQFINYGAGKFIVGADGKVTVPAAGLTIGANIVTLGGAFTTSGAFALTLTQTGATNVTLPTSGTLATLGSPTFTGTVTIPTPFTLGAISVTATGTQLNYLNAATGTTGTTSTNLVFSASPTFTGTLTAAAITYTGIGTQTAGTITTDTPALTVTQTWNASGVAFKPIFMNVTNTASSAASRLMDLQAGSTSCLAVDRFGAVYVGGTLQLTAANVTIRWGGAGNVGIYRPAANVLAQVNSTTGQAWRLYNTYTDDSNGEWLESSWSGNVANLVAAKNGSGTARVFQISYGGTTTAAISVPITSGAITFGGNIITLGGAVFHQTSTALTDGAGASAGTLGNAPAIGNPTKWIGINDNGTTRYIPAW